MKLFSLRSWLISGAIAVAACCCNGPNSKSSLAFAAESNSQPGMIERNYLIRGMTCGGCIFGVKKALKRAGVEKNEIEDVDYKTPDPEHSIGHAKIKFNAGQYKGLETDCKIIREIRDNPGYVAYLDPTHSDPCGLDRDKKEK